MSKSHECKTIQGNSIRLHIPDCLLIGHSSSQSHSTTHQTTQLCARQLRPSIPDKDFTCGFQVKTNCHLSYLSFRSCWLMFYLYGCLAHVINLANIDVMGHITKITAMEMATAIWEYDPSLTDNLVLGGSLDVIAVIQTVVIKVWFPFLCLMISSCCSMPSHRFKPLVNISRCSTSYRLSAESQNPSRYLCTATYNGVQHTSCMTSCTNFTRLVHHLFLFLLTDLFG